MDKVEASRAAKNGAIAACISGTLTLLVVLVAVLSDNSGALSYWNDPFAFIDIAILFGCAYGVYGKSRTAAIILVAHLLLSHLVMSLESGKFSGVGLALIFLYFYIKAIQGTFVFHKIEKKENPDYKPTRRWVYFTVIPASIILFAIVGLGILTMVGVLPSTEVQAGDEIPQRDKDLLVSHSVIAAQEPIEYFYSWGFASILEGGSVLTESRVILYLPNNDEALDIYELYIEDITSIELVEAGNTLNDSVYRINSYDPDAWLQIALSAEDGGDSRFVEAIRSKLQEPDQ